MKTYYKDDFIIVRDCDLCKEPFVAVLNGGTRKLRCDESRFIRFVCNNLFGFGKFKIVRFSCGTTGKLLTFHVRREA